MRLSLVILLFVLGIFAVLALGGGLLKQIVFWNTQPDDRCPCGSGRKYKNCCGVTQSR